MARIGVRELRQHASRYLEAVKRGETVEVTERGRLVARLVPVTDAETARERFVADGRLLAATRPFEVPSPVPLHQGSTAEVLDALREERG